MTSTRTSLSVRAAYPPGLGRRKQERSLAAGRLLSGVVLLAAAILLKNHDILSSTLGAIPNEINTTTAKPRLTAIKTHFSSVEGILI